MTGPSASSGAQKHTVLCVGTAAGHRLRPASHGLAGSAAYSFGSAGFYHAARSIASSEALAMDRDHRAAGPYRDGDRDRNRLPESVGPCPYRGRRAEHPCRMCGSDRRIGPATFFRERLPEALNSCICNFKVFIGVSEKSTTC